MESLDQPLYMKLGLFTKRKLMVFIILFAFVPYAIIFILGEDKALVILLCIVTSILIGSQTILIYLIANLIFSNLATLFGIDIKPQKIKLDDGAKLITLFEEGTFQNYQKSVVDRFLGRRILLIPLMMTIIIIPVG